jgi:hypothetical protein
MLGKVLAGLPALSGRSCNASRQVRSVSAAEMMQMLTTIASVHSMGAGWA